MQTITASNGDPINMNTSINPDTVVTTVSAPQYVLQSVLTALRDGKIPEAVDNFDDHFTFNDHGLGLEFADKERLSEFFRKSRELFPETVLEVISIFECGDHVIAEWKITATETLACGSLQLRSPISLPGASIVRVENGRIISWSDYYDQGRSRRIRLAAHFTEWTEY